ncbi:MAG: DNA polymerase III subunit gamma/tau [Candidatus Paceibacter sp.]|nr:DNA polymerase III subunit gamma/tau [Candidatus Paceibacter sp.]
MSDKTVLYRKYRPKSFADVLGQDHIVGVLKNAVKSGRVAHAYLFAGPRGTGKTSVARILAREIGCADIDLLEIDAASSRGIDEIRALRDAVRFSPVAGKVKVYIIDEAHMLTKEAFNALLKTLEEPPAHAVFILATTELEKVPETIVSRCQSFSFRHISDEVMRRTIMAIAGKEDFKIDEETAALIALLAEGSFRDAQGLLDQLISAGGKAISGAEARKILSAPPEEAVEGLIEAMMGKNAEKGIEIIQKASETNLDFKTLSKLLLRGVRFALLLKLAPAMRQKLEKICGAREFKFADKIAKEAKPGELEKILKTLLDAYEARGRNYMPQVSLELAFLKIIN